MIPAEKLHCLQQLLATKRPMSLRRIMQECDISRRTTFRYFAILKDLGIEVDFDARTRMYRQSSVKQFNPYSLSEKDIIIVALALSLLAASVDEAYGGQIHILQESILKVITDDPNSLRLQIRLYATQVIQGHITESDALNRILINYALGLGRGLEIESAKDAGPTFDNRRVRIESPSLEFKREWHVVDQTRATVAVPLSEIQTVSFSTAKK
jgi:predicted DNA-binding transcriptional regulator YafY